MSVLGAFYCGERGQSCGAEQQFSEGIEHCYFEMRIYGWVNAAQKYPLVLESLTNV